MKKLALVLTLMAFAALQAPAQVAVEVLLDQDQFLPGEAIMASVRISNRSGQPVKFGEAADWLTFSVESREGLVVPKNADAPVDDGEFVLDSPKRATKRVDIAPYFTISQAGRYSVVATVKVKEWGREITSQPKTFNLIEGSHLWEQEFGVPNPAASTAGAPEVRKYVLQQANYLKGQLRFYVKVTDGTGAKVFRTVAVGTALSFSQPDPRLDKHCNLHLLYQSWAKSFSYTVFNPDGELVLRRTYDYSQTRPRFDMDPDGNISIVGGTRRIAANDFPPPASPSESGGSAPQTK
jgi:hypothetical protein